MQFCEVSKNSEKKNSFIRQTYITMYLFLIKPTTELENITVIYNVSLT